jgi:hypothetical protein
MRMRFLALSLQAYRSWGLSLLWRAGAIRSHALAVSAWWEGCKHAITVRAGEGQHARRRML